MESLPSRAYPHRTADVVLTIRGVDGLPLAGREVVVAQRSHAFAFGCSGFEAVELAGDAPTAAERTDLERTLATWLELFDAATLPYYWGRFEPERGRPDTQRVLAAARWFLERGCRVKGHPLCWHTLTPDWLGRLPLTEVEAALRGRITRDVTDAAGLIDTWDAVNEAVIMPVFDRYDNGITRLCRELGRVEMVRLAFETARRANPGATLLLNDFDTSADFEHVIEACLDAGIAIDALGIQSHMHQGWWGVEKTLDVLGRFARFGLPIHFTESTLVSGDLMPPEIVDLNDHQVEHWPSTPEGEARQAEEVVAHYTTLLAEPAVAAITWWEVRDGGWLNAPAGLVRVDGTRKPAFEALHRLIKGEWWLAPTPMVTDDRGRVAFTGFLGAYEASGPGGTASVTLDRPGPLALEVRLGA